MDNGIYVNDAISLSDVDAIIFDCDGVLIDVTNSYDKAIIKTTDFILKEFANISNAIPITTQIIDEFKKTGGFNDEVDLTYASIISLTVANKLKKDGTKFIFQVIENADQTGILSVEKYLDSLDVDISEIKQKLDYPGRHSENVLYSIFDQLFYGTKLYQKLFKKKSQFNENGFIENDKVIITKELLDTLKKKFNQNIAIVTGRGYDSISYSLKEILEKFNVKNSVFLEDEPRELAKPNPESLLRSIKGLNSSHTIFVGDSMEDLIMAQKATESGKKTTFCGIIGTSKEPDKKRNFFEKNGASLILDSIQLLPKLLNLVWGRLQSSVVMMKSRQSKITRTTKETDVTVSVNLDGTGKTSINTGISFLDHLISALGKHGMIDLQVKAKSRDKIEHHLIEDTGIAIGSAIDKALGNRSGITRFSYASVPMDESLAEASIDLVKRPYYKLTLQTKRSKIEEMSKEDIEHFFQSLLQNLNCCIHLTVKYGDNDHHKIEAAIKSLAVALRTAASKDKKQKGIPSTKGTM